jgi:hypothetical protein
VSSVSLVLPLFGALCWLIIKISLLLRPLKKNRPSAGGSAVEVVIMLYDSSVLMKCQVKKYSGLNFARKIRLVAPDISSKIWYCGSSIGLTYDGLIASANFCRNRFCPTCQWRRSVKLFRQNYECFEWIKNKYPGCRFVFLTLTVRNVPKTKATENAGPASCANNAIISVTSIFMVISSKIVAHIYLRSRAKPWRKYHTTDKAKACESNDKS